VQDQVFSEEEGARRKGCICFQLGQQGLCV